MTKTNIDRTALCVKTKFLIGGLTLIISATTGFYAYKTVERENEIFYLTARQKDNLKEYCKVFNISEKSTCAMMKYLGHDID